jgi:hypothetical protein
MLLDPDPVVAMTQMVERITELEERLEKLEGDRSFEMEVERQSKIWQFVVRLKFDNGQVYHSKMSESALGLMVHHWIEEWHKETALIGGEVMGLDPKGFDRLRREQEMAQQITQLQQERDRLLNLLAVVHGDGGHRAGEVGIEQAAEEAIKEWGRLREQGQRIKVKVDEAGACRSCRLVVYRYIAFECGWEERRLPDIDDNPAPTWCPLRAGPVVVEADTE